MPKILSFVLALTLVYSSCNQAQNSDQPESNVFFSLEQYFEKEAERLNKEQLALDKTIIMNGKEEQQKVEGIDFQKELSIFKKSDINKLAWADKYAVDSLFSNTGQLQSIHYEAKEENLKTREIHLYFKDGQSLDSLRIRSKSETALASNENWLLFEVNKGYHIVTEQENFSGNPTSVEIKSVFSRD